ncbi:AAA family ATPase [Eubacteriales bacterium OttesenSCG-928-M02]|nr:AAA family ATPase [Eubacteriales bacterium OttesenSCG-928-M02]
MGYCFGTICVTPAADQDAATMYPLGLEVQAELWSFAHEGCSILMHQSGSTIEFCHALYSTDDEQPTYGVAAIENYLRENIFPETANAIHIVATASTAREFGDMVTRWFFAAKDFMRGEYIGSLAPLFLEDLPQALRERLSILTSYEIKTDVATTEEDEEDTSEDMFHFDMGLLDEEDEEDSPSPWELLESIHSLSGAVDFKTYVDELHMMQPLLSEYRTLENYPNQHLLFAIDSGNGCTTAMNLLGRFLYASNLFQAPDYAFEFRTSEVRFRYPEGNVHLNPDDLLQEVIDAVHYANPGLVGIHIMEWLDHMDSSHFRKLLEVCWEHRHKATIVFIVPFLDAGMLSRVHARINDVINVRTIQFPPFSDDELIEAAKRNLSDFHITLDDSAYPFLRHALARERSDQRFYGMQTMAKLSTEMLFLKTKNAAYHLNDAPKNLVVDQDFTGYWNDGLSEDLSGFEQLDSLIGLDNVKKRVREIVASIKAQKRLFEGGNQAEQPCFHMMFTGNPGTGKTMVARIIGRIFRENGLLSIGDLLEVSRWDMVGEFIGQTGPKTVSLCRSAQGSVMFIDEAYLLQSGDGENTRDFGREAIGALIAEMENNRDKFVVIMAGYENDMESLLKLNSGLRDRIPHRLHFQSYSKEQLFQIFQLQLKDGYAFEDAFLETAQSYFLSLPDSFIADAKFGNGRFVRNVVERVRIKALLRQMGAPMDYDSNILLLPTDFESAVNDEDLGTINEKNSMGRIGFR